MLDIRSLFLALLHGLEDLSSSSEDRTWALVGVPSLPQGSSLPLIMTILSYTC